MSSDIKETVGVYGAESRGNRTRIHERLHRILGHLTDEELDDLAGMDDLGMLAEIESRLASRAATDSPVGRALTRGHQARSELMRTTEMLSVEVAAETLGNKPESVHRQIQRGRLLSVHQGRSTLLPAFQFRDGRVLKGLGDCLAALSEVGEWTRLDWFMQPHPDFGEHAPAERLASHPDQVIAAAKRFGEQGGT